MGIPRMRFLIGLMAAALPLLIFAIWDGRTAAAVVPATILVVGAIVLFFVRRTAFADK